MCAVNRGFYEVLRGYADVTGSGGTKLASHWFCAFTQQLRHSFDDVFFGYNNLALMKPAKFTQRVKSVNEVNQ